MTQPSTPFELRATQEYRKMGFQIVKCPVCGKKTLDSHWICRDCGWEYDGTTEENEYSSCNKATPAQYRQVSTQWPMYRYYNAHPGGLHTDDCVKRAICVATGQDYRCVATALNQYKKVTGALRFNSDRNPHRYVENVLGAEKIIPPTGLCVSDFCHIYPKGRYILDLPGHWTCCIDGIIYDTWDCSTTVVNFAYRITRYESAKKRRNCCTVQPISSSESNIYIYDGNGAHIIRTVPSHLVAGYIRCLQDSHYTYVEF